MVTIAHEKHQYDPANAYNADKTGMYFRALPDGTLTFKSDDSGGSKKSKERVTALVACNMTGSDKFYFLFVIDPNKLHIHIHFTSSKL